MQKFKTWADFAQNYDLVLFNECVNLVNQKNSSFFEGVIMEWQEKHAENCDADEARSRIEELENSKKKKDIAERQALIDEFGEYPECQCEPMQWYAIAVSDDEAEWLNKEYSLDIFWSDTLQLHILPVYHFGTSWDHVNIK